MFRIRGFVLRVLCIFFSLIGVATALPESIFLLEADETVKAAAICTPEYVAGLLLPSNRQRDRQKLRFYRLMGNYDQQPNMDYPMHSQMFQGEHRFKHPQDPIAALLQTLYPSPDEDIFVANQAGVDPVREFTPKQLGQMLRHAINDGKASLAADDLRKALIACFNIKEKVTANYDEYLAYEMSGKPWRENKLRRNLLQYRALRFVNILVEAYAYQHSEAYQISFYGGRTLEKVLISYAWDKAQNLEEMDDFYSEALGVPGLTLQKKLAKKSDFEDITATLNEADNVVTTIEALPGVQRSLAIYGGQHFDPYDFFFPSYSSVKYRGKTYANCVETSISSFFMTICREYDAEQGVVLNANMFPEGSPVHKYFQTFNTMESFHSGKGKQAWSDLVVGRAGVRYVHKLDDEETNTYEVYPGIQNIHNVMLHLLGRSDEVEPLRIVERHPWKPLEEKFKSTVASLSTADRKITLGDYSTTTFNDTVHDHVGIMYMEMNGREAFGWRVLSNHAYLERGEKSETQAAWKKKVPVEVYERSKDASPLTLQELENVAPLLVTGSYYQYTQEVFINASFEKFMALMPYLEASESQFFISELMRTKTSEILEASIPILRSYVSRLVRMNEVYGDEGFANNLRAALNSGVCFGYEARLKAEMLNFAQRHPVLLFIDPDNSDTLSASWARENGYAELIEEVDELPWDRIYVREQRDLEKFKKYDMYPKLKSVTTLDVFACYEFDEDFFSWLSSSQIQSVNTISYSGKIPVALIEQLPPTIQDFSFSYSPSELEHLVSVVSRIKEKFPHCGFRCNSFGTYYEECKQLFKAFKRAGLPYESLDIQIIYKDAEEQAKGTSNDLGNSYFDNQTQELKQKILAELESEAVDA